MTVLPSKTTADDDDPWEPMIVAIMHRRDCERDLGLLRDKLVAIGAALGAVERDRLTHTPTGVLEARRLCHEALAITSYRNGT